MNPANDNYASEIHALLAMAREIILNSSADLSSTCAHPACHGCTMEAFKILSADTIATKGPARAAL